MGGDVFDWLDAQQEFSLKPQCTNLKYTLVSSFYSDCMVVNLKIMTKDLIMWSTYIETYKFFLLMYIELYYKKLYVSGLDPYDIKNQDLGHFQLFNTNVDY